MLMLTIPLLTTYLTPCGFLTILKRVARMRHSNQHNQKVNTSSQLAAPADILSEEDNRDG